MAHGDAGGVANSGENSRRGGDQRGFADALGTVGAFGIGILDDVRGDRRNIARGRDQIVVQVFGAARDVFFHQREAEALGDAAVDLTFHLHRIDRAADVVRGVNVEHLW